MAPGAARSVILPHDLRLIGGLTAARFTSAQRRLPRFDDEAGLKPPLYTVVTDGRSVELTAVT